MLKQTTYIKDVTDLMALFAKLDRGTQYSDEGFGVLLGYLNELSYDDNDIEIDVIELCCEFKEVADHDLHNVFDSPEQAEDACIGKYTQDGLPTGLYRMQQDVIY